MRKSLLLLAAATVVGLPAQAQQVDCAAGYPTTSGSMPAEVLANCAQPMVTVDALAPTDLAGVIHNNGTGSARVVTFIQNNAITLNQIAASVNPTATAFINAADFAGNNLSTLYFVSNENHFRSVAMAGGAVTTLPNVTAPASGQTWVGMGWDYVTNQMYVMAAATGAASFGVLNLTTGAVTGITTVTGTGTGATSLYIDLAFHPITGQMYVHDIGTDSIVLVDKVTGVSAPLGVTGLSANFGQGMDFDNQDNTLYLWAVNTSPANSTGVYSVSLTDGDATLVSSIGASLTQVGDGGSMTQRSTVANEAPANAAAFLARVQPNPVATEANVAFSVQTASNARLALYDVLGRQVALVLDGPVAAGEHNATLDVANLPAGTYVLRLESNGAVATRTVSVTR